MDARKVSDFPLTTSLQSVDSPTSMMHLCNRERGSLKKSELTHPNLPSIQTNRGGIVEITTCMASPVTLELQYPFIWDFDSIVEENNLRAKRTRSAGPQTGVQRKSELI